MISIIVTDLVTAANQAQNGYEMLWTARASDEQSQEQGNVPIAWNGVSGASEHEANVADANSVLRANVIQRYQSRRQNDTFIVSGRGFGGSYMGAA